MVYGDRRRLITFKPTVDYKTWYFNDSFPGSLSKTRVNFYTKYDGVTYSWFWLQASSFLGNKTVTYYDEDNEGSTAYFREWYVDKRTIYFDDAPTGTLRTWLEANATPI